MTREAEEVVEEAAAEEVVEEAFYLVEVDVDVP